MTDQRNVGQAGRSKRSIILWTGTEPELPVTITVHEAQPSITIVKHCYDGDLRLPMLKLEVRRHDAA